MASIKKRPGTQDGKGVWQAQFYVTDPETGALKQVRKSTGETSKKKALAKAIEFERAAQGVIQAGTDQAQKAKAILSDAIEKIERETFTQLTARETLAKLLTLATGEELSSYTLDTWTEEWLRRKSRDCEPPTMARYRSHSTAFLEWLGPERRQKPLESITGQDVRLWQEALSDGGRVGKTVLGYVKDIGAIFRAAIREGLISFNPCSGALGDIDTNDSQERKPFTLEEVAALIATAAKLAEPERTVRTDEEQSEAEALALEWSGLILAAAFTGLRLGDAARLSWESVDLERKRIVLIPSKTKRKKREVRIPIQGDLLTYLESAPIRDDSPAAFVFPRLAKIPVNGSTGLSDSFTAIMLAADVHRGKPSKVLKEGEAKGKGRITWEKGFHSLRHTFTSWLRNAGVSEEDRMALTGHSTRESHATYSHHDDAALRDAVAKLPTIHGGANR